MKMKTRIYIASDHAGVDAKEEVKKIIAGMNEKDFEAIDLGPKTTKSVDYPDYAKMVCRGVIEDKDKSLGILICGTGTGMTIAANKIKGIRAALGIDEYSAMMARAHNNANVLTLRAREFDKSKYKDIVRAFLLTQFSNEIRHIRRITKLE
jgi:ribose 5-phosphate isomerase B